MNLGELKQNQSEEESLHIRFINNKYIVKHNT